jgi:hypothetical protein
MRCLPSIFASVATLFGMLPGFLDAAETKVAKTPYHGWDQALTICNGKVEVIVVPEVGRVIQFRFAGEPDGPFWENPALFGAAADSHSKDWKNFGGDKTWPAPQADWEKVTGRGWPPPAAFDSMAVDAKIEGEKVMLISPIDPHFGIQTEREIRLHPNQPKMTIRTTYFKRQGKAKSAAIWVITQLKDPVKMYMPLPEKSLFPQGYNKQSEALPANLEVEGRMLTCTRSPSINTKIGSDASSLIWGMTGGWCASARRASRVGIIQTITAARRFIQMAIR